MGRSGHYLTEDLREHIRRRDQVYCRRGATFLGEESRIGTIASGKQADIVIVRGNPASNIRDIRNVQLVLKDGVGYDPAKLIASVRGFVGEK